MNTRKYPSKGHALFWNMNQLERVSRLIELRSKLMAKRKCISGLLRIAAEIAVESDKLKKEISALQIDIHTLAPPVTIVELPF